MATIGFHASHELFPPSELLQQVRRAEAAGFAAAMCSDHMHPWTPQQGHSGFSFAWLGAAMQACSLPMGTICCPTGRYHPAMVAQAAATLADLFPGRFWLAIGTGQALNEHITGEPWLPKPQRQAALETAASVIRRLWAGERVTEFAGRTVDRAQLYVRLTRPPMLLGAATTPETASWVGGWADGLLTVSADRDSLKEVVDAFRGGGGAGKPMYLQSMVGWHPDETTAWKNARDNWPVAALDQTALQDTPTPEELARACEGVSVDDLKGKLRVSSDLKEHRQWLEDDLSLGFDAVLLYTIGGEPLSFIDAYGGSVLPHFT